MNLSLFTALLLSLSVACFAENIVPAQANTPQGTQETQKLKTVAIQLPKIKVSGNQEKLIAEKFSSQFVPALENQLLRAGKYQIVVTGKDKRATLQAKKDEAFVSGQKKSNLLQIKTPDLILFPEITYFSNSISKNSTGDILRQKIQICVEIKLVNSENGLVVFSHTGTDERTQLINKVNGNVLVDDSLLIAAAHALAQNGIKALTDALFLPRVLSVDFQRGIVTLSAGSNSGVKPNDYFEIFELGEELIDPETGKKLGHAEIPLGKIKIISVSQQFCTGRFVVEDGITLKDVGISKGNSARKSLPPSESN